MPKILTAQQRTELLDHVSACQSAYHIDSTPGHRFGGLPSNLQENRDALVDYVESILQPAQAANPALKDAIFEASIEFIGTLTGMRPPPIEAAPPEVFKPFRDFTEKVLSILAEHP